VLLAIAAFSLSLLGTFLVRSGVLTSVHAFATDPKRGIFILSFLVVVIGSSLLLFAWRAPKIGLGGKFDIISRESMLLSNNVLLVVATASVFLGTLYPLFMDALGMGKLSVGPPYFNAVFVPLMTPLVIMMGLGPIARWKHASVPDIWVRVRWAFGASLLIALLLPLVLGKWSPLIALGLMLAFWVISTGFLDLLKRLGKEGSLSQRLMSQPRSYYGMQFAHFGIAIFIIGVTMVKGYETERDVRMGIGDTVEVGGYQFRFDGITETEGPNYHAFRGHMIVKKGDRIVTELYPEKRNYNSGSMPMTEAAIDTGILRDLYVSLGEPIPDSDGAWAVRVYYKPFVDWIWVGCMFMALGGIFAISDRRYRIHSKRAKQTETETGVGLNPVPELKEKTA
jgi:cytochrome c-type biogenesis protein CcmF